MKRVAASLLSIVVGLAVMAVWLMPGRGDAGRALAGGETANPQVLITRTVSLEPAKDNTLYQSESGALSNGAGQYLFAGRTDNSGLRRAVLAFDLAGVMPGATVSAATLTLHVSRTGGGDVPVAVHALARDWGEGDSDAPGEEGGGTQAAPGDATWRHTFYNTAQWTTIGGDYLATPLATTTVGGAGDYVWASAALTADVQHWLDQPGQNFGWIVLGGETADRTAKRFDSRENATAANRPRLTVTYTFEGHLSFIPVALRN